MSPAAASSPTITSWTEMAPSTQQEVKPDSLQKAALEQTTMPTLCSLSWHLDFLSYFLSSSNSLTLVGKYWGDCVRVPRGSPCLPGGLSLIHTLLKIDSRVQQKATHRWFQFVHTHIWWDFLTVCRKKTSSFHDQMCANWRKNELEKSMGPVP